MATVWQPFDVVETTFLSLSASQWPFRCSLIKGLFGFGFFQIKGCLHDAPLQPKQFHEYFSHPAILIVE